MNSRKASRNTIKSGLKRAISGIIAFTFVLNLSPSAEIGDWLRRGIEFTAFATNKDTVPEGTVYSEEQARVNTYYDSDVGYYMLDDVNKILDYSRAYYSYPDDHQDDVICINFGQGNSSAAINNFIAIGTEECPFNGTIKLTTSSNNTLSIPEAFFDYVYDSATIISETTLQPSPLILTRTMDDSGEPVLARHVMHNNDGEAKTWQVQLDSYNSTYNYSVGGFIGEMEDDAKIILDIIDNTTCDIYGTDDIGYVCGKMCGDSSLTINSITGSNSSYSISTNSGNAGGVVGSMEEDSSLILNCAMLNSSASVTASESGNYAGGIVGYNDGGSVVSGVANNASIFSSTSKYQILNTVSGVAGAGGVYGYYRPIFESSKYSFDISWLQIGTGTSARMAANGTGSVGGLFGVLVNEIKTTEGEITTYSSGMIEVKDNSDNSATIYLDHNDTSNMSYYGGLIGTYTACNLSGVLNITDVSVNVDRSIGSYDNFGGAIGITEGGNGNDTLDALYVKFGDYNVTIAGGNGISTSVYGGLVARSTNAFIEADDVTCNSTGNFYGGGVIGRMDDGVLRLSGTTDLTGGYAQISDAYYYEGQIVGGRDSSLIFAEKDWILKRSTACSVDDIGSWGEVLRFTGIEATETDGVVTSTAEKYGSDTVLTVDELAHTVTVSAPATQTTIGSIADYAMISLRFQLADTNGLPVVFDSSWSYTNETIITQDLTLGATFSLAGTGLTGLTRDNAETASDSAANCVYKGKFDGGGKTLTLATGEAYGQRGDTSLTAHTAQGSGKIYRHIYTGLFGIVDGDYDATTNYTTKDLTLSGTIDVGAIKVSDKLTLMYCGGFAARAIQDFTATNVKTEAESETTTGFRMTQSGNCTLYMGRFVGEMGSAIELISVASSEFGGMISGSNSEGSTCIGGVIGRISHDTDETRTWNFTTVSLKGSIGNTSAKDAQRIGGLVAEIDGDYNNNSYYRTLNLNGVTADGLNVAGTINSSGASGGLLGYSWLKTNVAMTDVTVKNTATVDIGTVAGNAAGIVYRATGHWTVTKLDIQNMTMTATNAKSVGAIVNKGYFYSGTNTTFYNASNRSALYLELPSGYTYNLAFSGENINSSAVFDELCTYTCPGETDIMKNGNGIISIHGGLYTDGSTASDTYHAQTSYGAKPNPNARYYYNLDTVTNSASANLTTPQMKLMSWGVNTYACKNLKQYFADPFGSTLTDLVYNMSGYSWYPVDLDDGITVNGTFTFYNKEFEDSEKVKYNAETSNAYKRTSLYDSTNSSNTQHYLMHNALFHDVYSCTMTVGHVVFSGDVAGYAVSEEDVTEYKATKCGALVCGTVSGSSSSKVGTITMGTASNAGITLAGIKVYNISASYDNALCVSTYAPLLVNKADSHSALILSNVSTSDAYNSNASSAIAATSLIGDVGKAAATDVNVDFTFIKLDGRNSTGKANADLSDASKGNFNSMYNTYNSIFSKATLLNSFSFESGSSGRYNFTWADDWDVNGDDAADSPHNGKVTYGKELGYDSTNYKPSGAVLPYYNSQYPDLEFMYSESKTKYANPTTASDTTHEYAAGFLSNFLPYVATKYDASSKLYQLQVNHGTKEASGCGTYNHPYVISKGSDIVDFCYWINSDATKAEIRIPTEGLEYDKTDPDKITAITGTWCTGQTADVECVYVNAQTRFECDGINYNEVPSATILSLVNPSELGLYESDGGSYTVSSDTTASLEKTYYAISYDIVTIGDFVSPAVQSWFELENEIYSLSTDSAVDFDKTYYAYDSEQDSYTVVSTSDILTLINPSDYNWYESDGNDPAEYMLSMDTNASINKDYYKQTYNTVIIGDHVNPVTQKWYERSGSSPNFTYTRSTDTSASSSKTYYSAVTNYFDESVLRTYLAGAYYKIADDAASTDLIIENTATSIFDGFGKSDITAYRFRGVFDGNNKTVVNKTSAPFIYYSNGSVVKDLTISVQPSDDITLVGYQKSFDNMCTYVVNDFATGNDAYGGIIARVMGGDNIIDNVSVSYASMKTDGKMFKLPASYAQLVPLGGYVGVVVNGGVIFRNMVNAANAYSTSGLNDDIITGTPKADYKPGSTTLVSKNNSNNSPTTGLLDSKNWLYVNPIVGRVINGFAVTESSAYRPYEDGTRTFGDGSSVSDANGAVTMQNGTKHYSIADINASETNGTKNDQIAISSNDVTVSSGQDFFLMSLIVNSGMAKKALGYNQAYQVSRSANYSDVGTTATSCTDYTSYAAIDKLSSSGTTTEFGYLAKTYVNSTDSTGNLADNSNLTIELLADVILPDGYKGMGNIYKNNTANNNLNGNYLMKVNTFTGNGHKISQNSSFLMYHSWENTSLEKFYAPVSNESANGFGLFNYQAQKGTYTNFILTGNVTTDLVNNQAASTSFDTEKGYAPYAYTNGNLGKNWLPATASLFGVSDAAMNLNSVAIQNVNVFGTRYTGGLIGYHPGNKDTNSATARNLTILNTAAGLKSCDIIVRGGLTVGGLIGKKQQNELYFDNANSSGSTCEFSITEVESLCTSMTDTNNFYNYGVGGVVGVCRGVTDNTAHVTLQNFTMGSTSQKQLNYVKCENANIYTGGLFGILNRQYLTLSDVTAYNLSVKSQLTAGGIVGQWLTADGNNTKTTVDHESSITNTKLLCNLNGEIKSTGAKKIDNGKIVDDTANFKYCSAGGLVGSAKEDMPKVTISDCMVKGYEIYGYTYSGGIMGSWGDSSTTAREAYENFDHDLGMNNCSVVNCKIGSNTSTGYAGGLLGNLNNSGTKESKYYRLYGYNLLVQDLTLTGSATGYVCGQTSDKNMKDGIMHTVIKIVGYTRQDTRTGTANKMTQPLVGNTTTSSTTSTALAFGTNGYVIFADYSGACLNEDYSTDLSNITNTSSSDIAIASPYVTITDKEFIDETNFLTGDAVGYNTSISYANSRIGSILTAASGGTDPKRYSTAYTEVGATATTNLISKLSTYGKYASYQKQMGSKSGTTVDFPVLVLDDATDVTATSLINNYLRYLTNTDYDFAAVKYSDGTTSASDVFNVEIGGCVWDEDLDIFKYYSGSYHATNNKNGAFLYNRNGIFSIADSTGNIKYDNEEGERFTLIDVQFKDPSDPTKIAYHLYVPILVKKMLYYEFHASFLSGTNYRVAPYVAKRGNTLIENIGNPITLEAQWTYDRDLAGWQTALESGDDFYHTAFDKRLRVLNHMTHTNGIPEGTKMVLIDANRNNAYYYANQGDSGLWAAKESFYNFDFSAFTGFNDPKLNDYFNVTSTTATENTTVRFEKTQNENEAIISDGTNYYKIDPNGTIELTLSYKNTIATTGDSENGKDGKIVDDYYITFFTNTTTAVSDLYHLEFSDWGTFEHETYPTLVSKNDHTHILTGDIFVNDNFDISNLKSNTKMSLESGSDYNDTIQAKFTVDVGVKEEIKNDIKSYFTLSSVEVYQSFLIMLNRQELTSSLQGIATRPDLITVSDFTISHNETYSETDVETEEEVTRERTIVDYIIDTDSETDAGMTEPNSLTTANYIELRSNKDLRPYMRNASYTSGLTYSISAIWELSYMDATKMAAQFPTRDSSNINNTNIGTLIGGSSNMSSTPDAAVYSKNVAKLMGENNSEITWESDHSYYCTINTNAELTLNSDDANNENGEFYQLGINANDIDEDDLTEDGYIPIKLNAVYDVSDLSAADTVESMKLTFTVSKKPDYGTVLPTFTDYVNDLKLYSYDKGNEETEPSYSALTSSDTGVSIDTSNTAQIVYIVDAPDEVFNYDSESKVYQIPVTLNAIIGDAFGNSKQYANYMVRLEVDMYSKSSNAEDWENSHIDGSNDDDHVIYTHAKILTNVIE